MKGITYQITRRYFSSQISLTSNGKTVHTFPLKSANINWELAKVWINPKGSVVVNTLSKESAGDDTTAPKKLTSKEVGIVKFTQYFRKIGKIISASQTIYVQQGVIGGKQVQIVSNEKDTLQSLNGLFESQSEIEGSDKISILHLTKGELNVNPFIIADKDQKVILSNSKNLSELKQTIAQF